MPTYLEQFFATLVVSVSTVENVQRTVIIRRSANNFQMEEQKSGITVNAIAIIKKKQHYFIYSFWLTLSVSVV
jgi:hypothetical protein